MKKLALIVLLAVTEIAYCQPALEWATNAKAPGHTNLILTPDQLIVTDSGYIYLGGTAYDSIFGTIFMAVAKLNSTGSVIWSQFEKGVLNSGSELISIASDSYENLYSSGTADISTPYQASYNSMYLPDGTLNWTNIYDTINFLGAANWGGLLQQNNKLITLQFNKNITIRFLDSLGIDVRLITNDTVTTSNPSHGFFIKSFICDRSDNIYVFGEYLTTIVSNERSYFLKKFDSIGNFIWERFYNPTTGFDSPVSVRIFNDTLIVITGSINSLNATSSFGTVAYDSSGNQKWVQTYSNAGLACESRDMEIDSAGNIYVSGWCLTGVGIPSSNTLIKYDAYGVQQWVRTLDSNLNDQSNWLALDKQGFIYVSYNRRFKGITTAKYDPAGNLLWKVTYKDTTFINTKTLKVDKNGNIYTGGGGIILKYSQTVSVAETADEDQILLYPNPSSDRIYLNGIPLNKKTFITIYDQSGRQVIENNMYSSQGINIGFLSAGIYIAEVKSGTTYFRKKVVKM